MSGPERQAEKRYETALPSDETDHGEILLRAPGKVQGECPGDRGKLSDFLGEYLRQSLCFALNPNNEWSLIGTESIGLDAQNPNRLYFSCGWLGNSSQILISTNQGVTFTRINSLFVIRANNDDRGPGERFGVDPNLDSTIFYGTRENGLWKSVNYTANWAKFNSDYRVLIAKHQELRSRPTVYVPNPFGTAFDPAFVLNTVIPAIQTIAAQTGVTLIDNNTDLLNVPELFSDGVHPTVAGAGIIAEHVAAVAAAP